MWPVSTGYLALGSLLPEEFGAGWTQLQNSADKTFTLIKRRRGCWEVEFTVPIAAIKKRCKNNKAQCEPDLLNLDLVREEQLSFLQTKRWQVS